MYRDAFREIDLEGSQNAISSAELDSCMCHILKAKEVESVDLF